MIKHRRFLTALLPLILLLLLIPFILQTASPVAAQTLSTKWKCNLIAGLTANTACAGGSQDPYGHNASPALADIDNDGVLDVVVATMQGRVIAIKDTGSNGRILFNVDIAPYFGIGAGSHSIESSPAVADIDNDGRMEIVVGVGSAVTQTTCKPGGVIVLEHNGAVKPGWPQLAADNAVNPVGCPDPVYGTPALGDLDNDGDLEIVVGGFDKRIMAWHHTGAALPGFPIHSALTQRFPGWTDSLYNKLADTIWGSPALADLNNDGFLDIVIGTDEGNFDDRWSPAAGWSCPYAPVFTPGYCGGALYGIDRFGNLLPGFPKRILETIQSTPALYDTTGDGTAEIFVGTGTFYNTYSADHPTYGMRLFGWSNTASDISGWSGGKATSGTMPAAPAIGDIDGDGDPEIIALSMDTKLYAWHHNGALVSGFPMIPKDSLGNANTYNVGRGPILADVDGNGRMEIILTTSWSVVIVNGSGQKIAATSTSGTLNNIPAVGDIDGDGKLELVAQNSTLTVWNMDQSGSADWPMFKQNPARTSTITQPTLEIVPGSLTFMTLDDNQPLHATITLNNVYPEVGEITWSATKPNEVSMYVTSSIVTESLDVGLTIATNTLSPGENNLGDIQITATVDGLPVKGTPATIPVTVHVVNEIFNIYLPAIQR